MAVGSNVVSIVVQATDQATAPLKRVQAELQQTGQLQKAVSQQMAQAADTSGRAQQRAADQAGEASLSFRHKLLFMSSAMAGAAAIGSVLAQNNQELSHTLQTVSLAISGAGTAVHAFANILRGAALLVGGWTLAIAGAVAAVIFLVRNWDQAVEFAKRTWTNFSAFIVKLWGGIAQTAEGIGEILAGALTFDSARIQRGLAEFRTGIQQLGAIASNVGAQIGDKLRVVWDAVTKFFSGPQAQRATGWLESLRGLSISATQAWINMATRWEAAAKSLYGSLIKIQNVVVEPVIFPIDWAEIEKNADPILRGVLATLERFKQPWEEATQGADDFGKQIDELMALAKPLADELDISVADAADLVRAAMKRATDQSISFKHALDDILFERRGGIDWLKIELGLVGTKLKTASDALAKFKFGPDDFNIDTAPSGFTIFSELAKSAGQAFANIRASWGQSIGEMAVGLKSFGDGANAIWDAVRVSFAGVIAKMVTDWLTTHVTLKAISAAWAAVELALARAVAWARALAAHAGIPFVGIILGIAAALAIIGAINQPRLAEGGIVTRPMNALIGEAGPEAVIPLSQMGGFMGGGGGPTVIIQNPNIFGAFDAWELSKTVRQEIAKRISVSRCARTVC